MLSTRSSTAVPGAQSRDGCVQLPRVRPLQVLVQELWEALRSSARAPAARYGVHQLQVAVLRKKKAAGRCRRCE